MPNVEVIKGNRLQSQRNAGINITRLRVAPYVRVSTNDEDQTHSYNSQKKYYTELTQNKPEWVLIDIYADKAVTGTKTDKRDNFQRLINDCLDGKIDLVIAKSISRFARNTVDTLKYVRMLKDRGIAVLFEEDYIKKRPYTTYGRFSCNIILYIVVSCCIPALDIVPCRLLVA